MIDQIQIHPLKCISLANFTSKFVNQSQPVILKNSMPSHSICWDNKDDLIKIFSDRTFPVTIYQMDQYTPSLMTKKEMTFSEYLKKSRCKEEKHYISDVPIYKRRFKPSTLGFLGNYCNIPPLFDKKIHLVTSFFYGYDSFSKMHYHHEAEAILCQVRGRKKVVLYNPLRDFYKLYPYPFFSPFLTWSKIDMSDPKRINHQQFPKLSQASPLEVTLESGDSLYIPPFWWHVVYGLKESISITHFWKTSFSKKYGSVFGLRSNYFWQPFKLFKFLSRKITGNPLLFHRLR